MNTDSRKRQNRALIVTTALIVTIAAVILSVGIGQRPHEEDGKRPHVQDTFTTTAPRAPETTAPPDRPTRVEDTTAHPELKKPTPTTTATTTAAPTAPTAVPAPLPEFIAPVSGMLMKEHSVDVPVYSRTMEDYRTHTGVDIAASAGTAVRATAAGTVTDIWEDPMMGRCLRIAHNGGAVSVYRNLAPEANVMVLVGDPVNAGEIIGTVGESALAEISEETHLHYELHIDNQPVDPADFILIGTTDTAYEG